MVFNGTGVSLLTLDVDFFTPSITRIKPTIEITAPKRVKNPGTLQLLFLELLERDFAIFIKKRKF